MTVPASSMRRRASGAARAVTLVELVVVMVLVGVLMAMIVPHLEGLGNVSADRQAQASVDSSLAAEVTLHDVTGAFSTDPATLSGRLPGVSFVASPATTSSDTTVSVALSADGNTLTLAAQGTGSDCWILQRDFAAPSGSPAETYALVKGPSGGCSAAALPAGTVPSGVTGASWAHPVVS